MLNAAIIELHEVFAECSSPDWDGYGGEPVTIEAFRGALAFLRSTHPWKYAPAVVPEPDGAIGLEWTDGEFTYVASFHADGPTYMGYT